MSQKPTKEQAKRLDKRGRPEFAPTPEQRKMVEGMIRVGLTQEQTALVVGIARDTLAKHFREEIDRAKPVADAQVANNLIRQATKDDFRAIPAAIYYTKAQMGWRETQNVALDANVTGVIAIIASEVDRKL
jgi:DNA-binding XRE family transcriptional regulator